MAVLTPVIPRRHRLGRAVPDADRSARAASPADRRLAAGLARRDPAALAELHATCGRTVLGFLVRSLGDRGTAEDVFQQVFLEVWERGAYDPERASPLTWVMMIARSRAIDQLRRRVPEPRDPSGSLALLEGEADPRAGVEALADQWRFAELLGRLPAQEESLLRIRFYEGLSQSEIAGSTGIPLGTVKTRMVQGLARLRRLMDDEERAS
jgi:RNA polymerase sigma-70 factor (ECF subfamily)